jgi:hypothetical protein
MARLLRLVVLLGLVFGAAATWRWLRGPEAPVFSEPWPSNEPWPAIDGP